MDASSWFNDIVTVKLNLGATAGQKGDPNFSGAAILLPCRIIRGSFRYKDADGNDQTTDGRFETDRDMMLGVGITGDLTSQDAVWFPGTDTSKLNAARRPQRLDMVKTKDGAYELIQVTL